MENYKNVTRFSIIRFIFLHFRYIVRRSGEFFRSIRQELNINWRQGVLRLLLVSEMEKRGYIFVTQITTDTFSQAQSRTDAKGYVRLKIVSKNISLIIGLAVMFLMILSSHCFISSSTLMLLIQSQTQRCQAALSVSLLIKEIICAYYHVPLSFSHSNN